MDNYEFVEEIEIDGITYTVSKVNTKDGKVLSGIDKLATDDNKEILRKL